MQLGAIAEAGFAVVGSVWLLADLSLLRDVCAVSRLPERTLVEPPAPPSPTPRVTAVVPVRDEAARIEGTVRGLLATRGVELDVVVVDDRSTDGTGEIVARIAREDARVRVIRVDALPNGWLGKPHACQRGAERALGDWILFTDGDVHIAPDVVARSVAAAVCEQVEHVVLTPGVDAPSLAARAGLGCFALALIGPLARANRDERFGWAGIGAFNLVTTHAWRSIGGHAALAYEVVDDMKLGLLLRRGGFRTRGFLAGREVRAAWGGSAREIVRLLEKNLFAFFGFHAVATMLVLAIGAALFLAGPLGLFYGIAHDSVAGLFAGCAWLALTIPAAMGSARDGSGVLSGMLAPFGPPILLYAAARSMVQTLRRGGVVWRGTLYPLRELRARRVRGFDARRGASPSRHSGA